VLLTAFRSVVSKQSANTCSVIGAPACVRGDDSSQIVQFINTCTCPARSPAKLGMRHALDCSITCVADAASRPVEVLLRKGAASGSGADLAAAESPDVVWLTGLGYSAAEALTALQANAGDREAALASLYTALTSEAPDASESSPRT